MRFWLVIGLAGALTACATAYPGPPLRADVPLRDYRSVDVRSTKNQSGKSLPEAVTAEISQRLQAKLLQRGFASDETAARSVREVAVLRSSLMTYEVAAPSRSGTRLAEQNEVIVKAVAMDKETGRELIDFVVSVAEERPAEADAISGAQTRLIDEATTALANEISRQFARSPVARPAVQKPRDEFAIQSMKFTHDGNGLFVPSGKPGQGINLKQVRHTHDLAIDTDVMPFTNVTLNDKVPPLIDDKGRDYALITLYNIDPPLDDLPSREAGIDRGIDFRDPANLVKSAYSNYVSPVFTQDQDGRGRPVPGHPIGHFLVKLQLPGYPTVLTGMTTTKRADDELADLTLGRRLGIGGVLLTPQPGRLNTAAEAVEELSRRQNELIVTDGRYYRNVGGKNVGPTYVVQDGNVTFARFRLPPENARDALRFFLEYVQRDTHNTFGSIINRPHKGTGAGCSAFAFAWLKASGIVPFVDEAALQTATTEDGATADRSRSFWSKLYRRINVPWAQVGCDDRLGLTEHQPAQYTVFDNLFYRETTADLIEASQGLTAKIRSDIGVLGATLFQFGAFTPLRDLVIRSRRKDPKDLGDYAWAPQGVGLAIGFWDNGRFSDWIKGYWSGATIPQGVRKVREGRFYGIEVDAMNTTRQTHDFFEFADEIIDRKRRLGDRNTVLTSCESVFALGLQ